MKYYHILELILDFLSSLAWPIVAITILLILKEPLKKLIGNIKKIGYGGAGIETNYAKNQENETTLLERLGDGNDESYLDNALAKFSEYTLNRADEIIEQETQISTVEGLQNQYDRIYKYSKLLVLIKNFEKMYDSMYGSQIRFLQRLNHTTTESKEDLMLYYNNAKENYPNVYRDYSYKAYLNFLYANGLVIDEDGTENISISVIGKDYLRYLLEANLSLEKPY
ncbi:hypothetical protein ACFS5M_12335 [Lacinutrix iliipiscaria]|uniref:Uncharacterized protein n=1 Tax=Lacinutrix iliipiscaria TaxID=1230532 RepID=A0ABW5WQ99_9FLAO